MKRCILIASCFLVPAIVRAGDEPILPRFKVLEKSPGTRLLRVLGAGELPPLFTRASDISADGKTAAYVDFVGATEDKIGDTRVLLWDIPAGRFRKEILVPGHITALALSADASTILIGAATEDAKKEVKKDEKKPSIHTVALWDAMTGRSVRTFGTHKDPVFTIAFSAKEDQAVSTCWSEVKCWSLPKGTLRRELSWAGQNEEVFHGAFLPDGDKLLVVVGHKLRIIDLNETDAKKAVKGLLELMAHVDTIVGLAVFADGKTAVSASRDGTVRSWDLVKGKPLHVLKKAIPQGQAWPSLGLAADGKTVLSCWSDSASETGVSIISQWDAVAGKEQWSAAGNYRGTVPIRILGQQALIGGGCNVLTQWDLAKGTVERSWGGHKAAISAVSAGAEGRLYSAGQDGFVHVWDKGQIVRSHAAHAEPIVAMTLNQAQTRLYTASGDKTVKVWNTATGKLEQTLTGHTAPVTSIVLGKDGKRAYTGSGDRTIKIWDLESGKAVATLTGHSEGVNAVALSADESWLASGSDDTAIRVWPIKNDQLDGDREVILLEQHKKAVTCLAFSPDGKSLVSGSQDNSVMVWDWAKGKRTRTLAGHNNWITSLAFADAGTLFTTSDDLAICRWDLTSAKETGRIDFGVIGDCPRCLTLLAADRFIVGTSSWMLFDFEMKRKN